MKRKIVISAVNIVEGGTLTILRDCLSALSNMLCNNREYEVIAIVNNKSLCQFPNLNYIEIKWAKKNWINRIYCEYLYFRKMSEKLNPYFWLSLHDMSPNVKSIRKAVYCHNSTPFFPVSLTTLRFSYKIFLFSLFYKYLYRINIKKNDFVVVQQDWIRKAFVNMYKLEFNKIIVAYPPTKILPALNIKSPKICTFFYPSIPRFFKNFELICEACRLLNRRASYRYRVLLTLSGKENSYSKYVYDRYKDIPEIEFVGLLPYKEVCNIYEETTCLIFPSKLETWGLPITEFAAYGRPLLIADLPYAHETASNVNNVCFFDPNSALELSVKMENVILNNLAEFSLNPKVQVDEPMVTSWQDLFAKIL